MVYMAHRVAAKCKCLLKVKKLCACLDSVKQCDGGTVIAQIYQPQGVLTCVDLVTVRYQPEGGSLMMYTVDMQYLVRVYIYMKN